MTMNYAYTPQIWPPVITALLLIALAVYCLRRRSVPGALPFTFALLFGALWMAGSSLEVAAVDAPAKIFWVKFQAAWLLPSATAVTCFLLEFAWPGHWLTRRNLALLSIPCLLSIGMILTNNLHHLVWQAFALESAVIPLRGPGYWTFLFYAYGLGLVNLVVLAWLFIRSPQHRWPVILILAGQVAGRMVYALEAAQVIHFDLKSEVISFWFPIPMYVIALFGFRFLNPIRLAYPTVIAQMREGMLVVDRAGRVAGLNPAACAILGLPDKRACGLPVRELLPSYALLQDGSLGEIEIGLGKGMDTRHYLLTTSHLKDWRGQEAGRLLLLHDVSEQKQAQAQVLEQQRALAALHERERLARELHDSLGQTLAAAHLQASTARLLLARSETPRTDECLKQIADMTVAAEADVREYLLGAKTTYLADRPFFVCLREYVRLFSQQYNLKVELNVPAQLEAQGLGSVIELQLMRILQEALSNVRKHARAKNVQVVFAVADSSVQIGICDDGQGFDSTLVKPHSDRFGLQAMRERAEGLGGRFEVISQPGQGTQVKVQLPAKEGQGRAEMAG